MVTTSAASASSAARRNAIVRNATIWDNHACMPLRPGDTSFLPLLEMHRQAGVSAVTLNVAMDMIPWADTFKVLATMRGWIRAHPQQYVLGDSVAAIKAAKASGRMAVLFDIEGAAAVDDLPELADAYYALGVRWMLIAYNRANRLGSGCQVADDTGLTDFGRKVITAMADVGMLLCCSHTGARTAMEAIEYNPNPTIFSHSNPSAVYAHRRNISDDLIRACAARGGVIGLVGFGAFVGDLADISVQKLADHADHLAEMVGSQHIGLGLDYVFDPDEVHDLVPKYPDWFGGISTTEPLPPMLGPAQIAPLVDVLLARGWTDADICGLLGGNWLRVAGQVWK
ncbi:dipeptidase [Blastomonas fulva]|jgi:membrane dipeptidase|uniref:dipeptidase n=1 Tax=Blastomonas fulva TaxID=1550728 RepID=UPI003D2C6449